MHGRKTWRFTLAVVAMAVVGSSYGWSSSAQVLHMEGGWSQADTIHFFAVLVTGIGVGAVIATTPLKSIGGPRTVSLGLIIWGVTLFLLPAAGLRAGASGLLLLLSLIGGIGVGIAYLALVSLFRDLMAGSTSVLAGSIGPFGFASGSGIASIALAQWPVYAGVAGTYRGFAAVSIACAILMLLVFKSEASVRQIKESEVAALKTDFWKLWFILFLNVAPGMALVAVATLVFANQGASQREAIWLLCLALPALPGGQLLWGLYAKCSGEKQAFCSMFLMRAVGFAATAVWSDLVSLWFIFAITLACHGGGFGLVPKIVGSTALRNRPKLLGYVLSAWGAGGVAGIALFYPAVVRGDMLTGFGGLALLMSLGVVVSSRYWVTKRPA
jgi:hypothetical protein